MGYEPGAQPALSTKNQEEASAYLDCFVQDSAHLSTRSHYCDAGQELSHHGLISRELATLVKIRRALS